MNSRFIHFFGPLVLTVAIVITVGCNRRNEIDNSMDLADSLMNVKPDSALTILNLIDTTHIDDDEQSARYALLKSMALDKNFVDTTSFGILQPAIDYYLSKGTANERLRTYYYQGRIYQNKGDDDSAMQCFMRGREYCQEASDTLTTGNLLVAQATIFFITYKIDEFIENNLEAARLYSAIDRRDYEMSCLAKVLDGSIHKKDKHLADSVMSIAQQRAAQKPELTGYIAPYILPYALAFGEKADIVDVLHYYETMNDISDESRMDMAEAYCRIGDANNACRYLESVDTVLLGRKSLKYLAIKIDVMETCGDLSGALAAYRKFSSTLDSIHMDIFSHDLLFAQKRHEMEKSNLMESQRKTRVIWIISCVTLVLIIIFSLIFYRYRLGVAQSRLDAKNKEKLQLEQEKLKRENENLALRNRKIELEKQNMQLRIEKLEDESDSLKEILSRRKELSKPIEDAIRKRIELLNALFASRIAEKDSYARSYETLERQMLEDKECFMNGTRLAFTASHPDFISYLEQHGLTEAEINYVCLYAIGLRGNEVGKYIQLKRHYHISSDIRKKLGIDEHNTNIGIYVRKLMKNL